MDDSPPDMLPDLAELLFQLQADLNFTRHLGGQTATDQLVELCQIDPSKHVLDVGCGVGITPCNLASTYGCKVIGVDLRESMIQRASERATEQGLEDRVQFVVADAQFLPFEDNGFDAILAESVLAFIEEKSRTLEECARVIEPGGSLGVTEATWIEPPPGRLVQQLSRIFGPGFAVLDTEGWRRLLRRAGLRDVVATSRRITARSESCDRFRRLGFGQAIRIWLRALYLSLRSSEYRSLPPGALSDPKELINYWGCGIYVGRKGRSDEDLPSLVASPHPPE
jgi:ubiquinone/menaquinone biosynthesis C-methylase UbiE